MKFFCKKCEKEYQSKTGLWLHNKKYHSDISNSLQLTNNSICRYCQGDYACKQSRWRHEKKCKLQNQNTQELEEKVKILNDKIILLEKKPYNTITNNNNNNNNITNIQYVINSPMSSTINHLTFENQQNILKKGLNSLTCLIENVNFNKSVPENHSYCVTAINDKHASVIDQKTNTIVKTNKDDLYDNVLTSHLDLLEQISKNPKFSKYEEKIYLEKINYLKTLMYQNNKFKKRYKSDINLISYNNKDMVKETWKNLKPVQMNIINNTDYEKTKVFDNLIDKIPENKKSVWLLKSIISDDNLSSSESETESCDALEINFQGGHYLLYGNRVYNIKNDGTKGKIYGTYINGKVNKM